MSRLLSLGLDPERVLGSCQLDVPVSVLRVVGARSRGDEDLGVLRLDVHRRSLGFILAYNCDYISTNS
jgi:hypothetical protein